MAENLPESQVVTKELLQKIIQLKQGHKDIYVKKFTVSPGSSKGDNYMCVILALRVTVQDGREEHDHCLILKTPSSNAVLKRWILQESKAFCKEVMVYKELIPDMIKYQETNGIQPVGPSVPLYYYGEVDDSNGILVLEDLHTQLYSLADRQKGLGYAHCKLVMKQLGIFHALSWAMKNGNPDNLKKYTYIFRDTVFEVKESPFLLFFLRGIASCVELVKICADDEEVQTRVQKLVEMDFYDTVKQSLKPVEPYAVICHGDAWCNNMLFKYKQKPEGVTPTEVKLLDLQVVRYALPSTDLAYFFYTSTTRDTRKKHLAELLRLYYSSFIDCLMGLDVEFPEFTFEVLEQQFVDTAIFGILLACVTLPMFVSRPEDSPEFDTSTSRQEMVDHNMEYHDRLLGMSGNNSFIKERLIGTIEDAIEMNLI